MPRHHQQLHVLDRDRTDKPMYFMLQLFANVSNQFTNVTYSRVFCVLYFDFVSAVAFCGTCNLNKLQHRAYSVLTKSFKSGHHQLDCTQKSYRRAQSNVQLRLDTLCSCTYCKPHADPVMTVVVHWYSPGPPEVSQAYVESGSEGRVTLYSIVINLREAKE